MCYSALFLKTNRIYRIFSSAKSSISRPPLISPQSQLSILSGIMLVQILLSLAWIFGNESNIHDFHPPENGCIFKHCRHRGLPIILSLLPSAILMIFCTWYAFKTRHFPKNYNEAKDIVFTMYFTCVGWAVFMPLFLISKSQDTYIREHLMCISAILVGSITLTGLFGPKIKLLLFQSGRSRLRTKADVAGTNPVTDKLQMKIFKLDAVPTSRHGNIDSNAFVIPVIPIPSNEQVESESTL